MLADLSAAESAVLLGGAFLGTVLTLLLTLGPSRRGVNRDVHSPDDHVSFLFSGTALIDATAAASILADSLDSTEEEQWSALRRELAPRFGHLPESPPEVFANGAERLRALSGRMPGDRGRLIFARAGENVRVSLVDESPDELDRQMAFDVDRELRFLRSAIADAPNPIWSVGPDGAVTWQNRAFSQLAEQARAQGTMADPVFAVAPADTIATPRRVPVQMGDSETPKWYEVSARATRDGFIVYATDADAVVRAEQAQRNFVQTLTKTFAHLSTGLAIFDRTQRLALFNPALIDLTAMPVDFLAAKPSLAAFFDHLREHQIMPEPKNYANWREKMSDVLAAARDGRYSKTWNLPSGLTYRVSGKPHPDGAVAFLIEDISAEISLTRRFRAELETSQAVLDRQDRALAVFSQMGVLTFSNDAFRRMWRFDPDSSFAETTISDVLKIWQSECAPNSVWNGFQSFASSFGERHPREARLIHEGLGTLDFRAEPLPGGATLMTFDAVGAPPRIVVAELADHHSD